MSKTNKAEPSLRRSIITSWRTLTRGLGDPYRPELHYMRGPGPKWREKHGQIEGGPTADEIRISKMTQATA
jgi:hypothetical protein